MKAIVHDRYGSADVLRHTDVDRPVPGPGEVLVRVHATSINFGDRAALAGSPKLIRLAFGLRLPKATVLGRDVAGTVAALGAGVTRHQVGDQVLGEAGQRAYAEYVTMPAEHLARMPAGITFEQAATLPVAATTAWQSLRLGAAGPGRSVLVNGASGGVGTFTVQLARVLGARVTGVCSGRNAELVRSLGAHEVVDYTREDVTRGPGRYDVIVDLAGSHPLRAMRRLLTAGGVYVCSTGAGGPLLGPVPRLLAATLTSPLGRGRLRPMAARRDVAVLEHLAGLVAAGEVRPAIERIRPLAEAAEAFRALDREHARGKIVLTMT